MKIRLDMKDCLMRIDTHPCRADGDGPQFPELADGVGAGSKYGSRYNNVTVLWMGPTEQGTAYGPWPFPQNKKHLADMGITLYDQDEAWNYSQWLKTRNYWYSQNGYDDVPGSPTYDTFSWNRP
jgi:hypothetical protein